MSNLYKIILLLTPLLFIGCGANNNTQESQIKSDVPQSPNIREKEKIPPSIPNI